MEENKEKFETYNNKDKIEIEYDERTKKEGRKVTSISVPMRWAEKRLQIGVSWNLLIFKGFQMIDENSNIHKKIFEHEELINKLQNKLIEAKEQNIELKNKLESLSNNDIKNEEQLKTVKEEVIKIKEQQEKPKTFKKDILDGDFVTCSDCGAQFAKTVPYCPGCNKKVVFAE